VNDLGKQDNLLTMVSEDQKRQYNESYFSVYRDDLNRLEMCRAERNRIEMLRPSGRIRNVGCGLGGFLAEFDANKWTRYGIEISDLAIHEARLKGIKVNEFSEAYNYPEQFFDVIVFRGSLQLIPTPFSAIKTCLRLLAAGGFLIFLSTPNSNSPYFRRFNTLPTLTPHANF
jgi:SAM-dependent methyltransferase